MYYQLIELYGSYKHAGSKAKNDCIEILEELHFKKLTLLRKDESNISRIAKIKRQIDLFFQWRKIYKLLSSNDTLLIQHPFTYRDIGRDYYLKRIKDKNVNLISLVHDVEVLRDIFIESKYKKEFQQMISLADFFIVHNDIMKNWFIEQRVDSNKLITLEIFDYLNHKPLSEEVYFDKSVTIAGNLSREKSPYIYELMKIKDVQFNLMGINFVSTENASNIHYLGAFESDDVPNYLSKGFGLVWDGISIETCDGPTGNYLRYNNPHKLSLYLSSGLPVIVWKESALAEFISSKKLGLVISSLYELSDILETITEKQYQEFVENIQEVREKLKKGFYLKKSINEILT